MATIPHVNSVATRTQVSSSNDSATRLKPAALDQEVVNNLAEQLQTSHPELIKQITAAIAKINQQTISDEEKKSLIAKQYSKAVKEFSASLTDIMQQNAIITSYKNKNAVLNACSAQIRNDTSSTDNEILLDIINKTNINLISFNGLLETYKQQVFGLSDDAPVLDDPLA
jgi:transcription elongation GreA/GreB family factor